MNISIYKKASDIKSTDIIDFEMLLDNIRDGIYWEHVAKVRNAKTKDEKTALKKLLPMVTMSGTFASRRDDAIIEHSGFIVIDIDNVDPMDTKSIICADDYVYAAFESVSGQGLAVIFKIDGKRHRDAFQAISEYLVNKYSIVVDPTGINVSRGRFVSHDPHIYINKKSEKWKTYIPKKNVTKVVEKQIIFVKSDFDAIVSEVSKRKIDLAGCYLDWLRIGFALADKFGEDGRSYWEIISQYRLGEQAKTQALINKQYDACLKAKGHGITIASFYFFAKRAGIETYSIQTKEIIKIAQPQKRTAGMSDADIIENLKEHSSFDHESIEEIVPQVSADTYQDDISLIELTENEIKSVWNIRRNVITRALEFENNQKQWVRLEVIDLNTIFLVIKKSLDKLSYDLFERILMSRAISDYNPFLEFFEKYKHLKPSGCIERLSNTITSEFGLSGEDRAYFIKKWFVGMISSCHGVHSPLMKVLTGEVQNTGKTQYFRRLLPDELKMYYAESKLDAGKDDEILMTQKLIIMDDEMGGKSKKENARIKELTSKQTFSLREPYGRNNVDLTRLAMLCGTSNENGVLNDPTGNRRIIPIHVVKIDHNAYNAINKTDLLMEAYWLWHNGFSPDLTSSDIRKLNELTGTKFDDVSIEEELIFKFFRKPLANEGAYYMTSEIIYMIEFITRQKLNAKRVGAYLQKNGVKRSFFKRNDINGKGYKLVKIEEVEKEHITDTTDDDFQFSEDAPF